jgi:hypothetical protein
MNISQFNAIVSHLATIAQNHGSLPSLNRMALAQYQTLAERCEVLASLEAELRLLATGFEASAGNGSTHGARIEAARAAVAMLDSDILATLA